MRVDAAAVPTGAVTKARPQLLRAIPAVNALVASAPVQALLERFDRDLVMTVVTETLAALRAQIQGGTALGLDDVGREVLGARIADALEQRLRPRLRRVINATGVVLHTNMGRSALAEEALAQIRDVATRYSNLELDLGTGERGSRYAHVEELLLRLTGAEAALVVNNNAGAVLLALSALCHGREVVVSRGELVEIGGAFRVPDVMVQGGASLVEVGTTNKTHLRDYERAITAQTAALLKVHTSNFRIVGFTDAPALSELGGLAHARDLPLLVDWGSGVMVDLARLGLEHEATMPDLIAQGADLITFSGDKLLGGPQAGFLVGQRELIERCRKHPLTRALRIDKLTLAGVEATLRIYLEPSKAVERLPTLRMLALTRAELAPRAAALAARIRAHVTEATVAVEEGFSQAGGGSLPGVFIPTVLVSVVPTRTAPHVAEARLRRADVPVMARVSDGCILLDPRTLWEDEYELVARALAAACATRETREE